MRFLSGECAAWLQGLLGRKQKVLYRRGR
jgi:hypothetical protein